MLIAGTRAALGIGIGLLISDRLNDDQRKAAGWALLAVGVVTTIPILRGVLGKPPVAVDQASVVAGDAMIHKCDCEEDSGRIEVHAYRTERRGFHSGHRKVDGRGAAQGTSRLSQH